MAMIQAVYPNVDARPLIDEVRERIVEELDYRREAHNQRQMAALFPDHPTILVPAVDEQLSSARVLTSQYVRGKNFYQFVETATNEQKQQAALTIREFVFDALWFHQLFNGDPHPGNYVFCDDGRIAFLDFGCVKRFADRFMTDFKQLNRYYLTGDAASYYQKACEMRFIKPGYEDRVDAEWLWQYARWFYLPILEDTEFLFTPDYCKQALQQLFGENMKLLNMPPDYVVLNRITFGLNSIFSRLGARANWRRLSKAYYFPDEPDPVTGV